MIHRHRKAAFLILLALAGFLAYAGYASRVNASSGGNSSGYGGYGSSTSSGSNNSGSGRYVSSTSASSNNSGMGMELTVNRPAFTGYYDGHKVTYLNTDVSSKAQAAQFHINYSAALAAAKGSPAIYFVQGRSTPNQVSVFGSEPGEKDYSPLWTETTVTWKAGVKPTLLTSDNQIASLVQKGKLTVHANGVILNCPIVSIGK